ncbi:unnamed protein product [Penicillium salamii]|nr:unnamed protein product [Penicillium salamii]
MVGVPHSKGCSLCRERRIKCDEAVPECGQCRKYGRTCPGYRRVFRFQDEGPNLTKRHNSGRQTASVVRTARPKQYRFVHDDSAIAADVVRENAIALMRQQSMYGGWDEKVTPSLVRKSFRAAQPQLFLDFISAAFPTLYYHNRFRSGDGAGFAEYIIMNYGQDSFMDSAICCLTSVYLAHLTKDQALARSSRQMYSKSLGEVIRAIAKPEQAKSDNMLCTSIILSVFEMYAKTTPDAWVIHSDGAKRLMISRGPEAHESGLGRFCWYAFRGFFIATAVHEGKACFLDEEEWQSYAAKVRAEDCQKPGEWSAYAEISDLAYMEIAKCPRYIKETRDLLASSTDPDPNAVLDIMRRIRDTSTLLYTLMGELRSCITAHNERQQGIIQRPGSFVGPIPPMFPDTGPSLLLSGAASMQETLQQLSERLEDRLRFSPVEASSPGSVDSPSDSGSSCTSSSMSSKSVPLPFRIHSVLENGPAKTADPHDPRAVIWLDRVASSMGVLGTRVLPGETDGSDDTRSSFQTS